MGRIILIIISFTLLLSILTSCADESKYKNLEAQYIRLEVAYQDLYSSHLTLNTQYKDLASVYNNLYSDYTDLHNEFAYARTQIQYLVNLVNEMSLNLSYQSPQTLPPTWQEVQDRWLQQKILKQQEELQRMQLEELKRQEEERRQRELMEQMKAAFGVQGGSSQDWIDYWNK